MALITINSVSVLSGTITMPLIGVWTADLVIDQPDGSGFDAGTKVTLSSPDLDLHGIVAPSRTGDFLDAVHVRVLGGVGGMGKETTPRSYAQPSAFARDVISGLTNDSGETLSVTADTSITNFNLIAWAITKVPVSQALTSLLDIVSPKADWRILPDGTLWFGAETWPSLSASFDTIAHNPTDGTYELGVDSPVIVPGKTVDGIGKISRVEHSILSNKIRSRVWVDMDDQERGFAAAVMDLAKQALPGIDYLALYDSKVVSQSADLKTVDLQPADPRLPGMGRVPLRHGLPGCTVGIAPGAILRLGWDRGNPQYPIAALWNGGETVTKVVVKATTVYLGDETGAIALPTKSDFDNHVHLGPATVCVNGASWTGSTAPPTAAAVGTLKVKAV